MNRRNIVQFKPEGVANIFSPTIKIHGETNSKNNTFKEASNKNENSYVTYPQQPTVTVQRQQMAQETARQNSYDEVYQKLFGNLMSNEYSGESLSSDLMADLSAPIPSDISSTNYELLASSKLKSLADCINKGGECVHRERCEPHNKIGHCFSEDYTCCKEGTARNTTDPRGRGGVSASGGYGATGASGGLLTSQTGPGDQSGDVGYLKWQTSSGRNIQRQPNSEASTGSTTSTRGVESNYFGVSSENDPYFCSTFCASGSYDYVTGKWKPRPCEGECAKCAECGKDPEETPTSGDSIARILFDNNRYQDSELKRVDPKKYISKINDLKSQISSSPNDDSLKKKLVDLENEYKNKMPQCHDLSENQCNADPNCFSCISTATSKDLSCKRHPDDSKIGICDTAGARACVPIYRDGGVDKADTLMPFRDLEGYQQGASYYNINDKTLKHYNVEEQKLEDKEKSNLTHILEYPKQCKGPIDREYTYEEQRRNSGVDRRSYY